jgi:hypothetical protein
MRLLRSEVDAESKGHIQISNGWTYATMVWHDLPRGWRRAASDSEGSAMTIPSIWRLEDAVEAAALTEEVEDVAGPDASKDGTAGVLRRRVERFTLA